MLKVFHDECASTLAQDEAGAIQVKRPRCGARPFTIAWRTQAAHIHEADVCNLDQWILRGA